MSKKKKTSFWDINQGFRNVGRAVGDISLQTTKEVSSFPAHAARELTGQPHNKKPKVGLKKGWFE